MRFACLFISLIAGPALAADLFPLQTGNSWTYRDAKFGAEFTVSVGASVTAGNKTYYSLSGYVEGAVPVRLADNGDLVYLDTASGSEKLLTSFAQVDGAWWDAPLRVCTEQGQTSPKRVTHDGPAGPIAGVLDIAYRVVGCADVGVVEEQFAENIGMMRRVNESISGPRQYDLVRARVGAQAIEALPYGRFTLSTALAAAGDSLRATLRLQTTAAPLRLKFPSGQEYDVAVRDDTGAVLWRWSIGKLFIQAEHELTVNGEWDASVDIPWPPAGAPANAVYTIQTWLTTAGDTPQFAAEITLAGTVRAYGRPHRVEEASPRAAK
ncbi:MAG TPA: BsuPI-related putative proteinase inhibitor [Bryobacteraceae bacterium]